MKTNFLKRIAQGGGLSLVKLVAGLAKIKALALVLGVDGLGSLALGLQFQATAVGFVSMSLAVGVINLGRPYWVADQVQEAGAVLGTALALVALNSVAFLLGFAVLQHLSASAWSRALDAQGSVWPLALAAVIVSFANVLWEGLSFLLDRFDVYVRSNIVSSLCDAVLFAGGAWLFGLRGALAASLIGSLVLFCVYATFATRAESTRLILAHLRVDWSRVRPLLSYGALMLGTTAMGLACMFLARAHLTSVAGVAANGYLQVVTALAAYLLPFVMNGVWGHLHPIAAASGDTEAARLELRRTLIMSMRLAASGCIAVVIGAPVLVRVIYTNAFLAAGQYISSYFVGELCFMFLSVVGAYLLAVGHKHAYFLGYALYHSLLLIGVTLAAATLGDWAYVLSHVAAAGVVALLAGVHTFRKGLIDIRTLRLVGGYAVAAATCCVVDYLGIGVNVGVLLVHVSWLLGPVLIVIVLRPFVGRLLRMDFS